MVKLLEMLMIKSTKNLTVHNYYSTGMVKTYQLSTEGNYGTSLKIAPMTTETELNAVRCFLVNGTKQHKIQPQSVLPALDGFEVSFVYKSVVMLP